MSSSLAACPQELSPAMPDWMVDETLDAEMLEQLRDDLEGLVPFHINDSITRELMHQHGVLDAIQLKEIGDYIRRFGPMLHEYELVLLPSFSVSWRQEWGPVLVFTSARGGRPVRNKIRVDHSLRYRTSLPADEAAGSLRAVTRMTWQRGRNLEARLVTAKGEGEPYLVRRKGIQPEGLSAYLLLRPGPTLRMLVLGDFRVQGGYGLRYGEGWSSWDGRFPLSTPLRPFRLMASATSLEGAALRGGAFELRRGMWRVTAYSGQQPLDGSLSPGPHGLEWSGGSAGVHDTPIHQAMRGRSGLFRSGCRLGLEQEAWRSGLSLERAFLRTEGQTAAESAVLQEVVTAGYDLQYSGRHSELGLEAAVVPGHARGAAAGWTYYPCGWIGLRLQALWSGGRLPGPQGSSGFSGSKTERMAMASALSTQWGKGWSLALGWARSAGYEPLTLATQVGDRVYALLEHRVGTEQLFRCAVSVKEAQEVPGQRGRSAWMRMQLKRPLNAVFKLEGGAQASLAGQNLAPQTGLGVYSTLQLLTGNGRLRQLALSLATQASEGADTRSVFWLQGPEGRPVMQTLYFNAWTISGNALLQSGKKTMLGVGLQWTQGRGAEQENRSILSLGLRLGLRPEAY